MNKIKVLTFGLIMGFAFIAVVSASTYGQASLSLTKKGASQDKVDALKEGNDRLTAVVYSKNDATLGLSLSKQGLFF